MNAKSESESFQAATVCFNEALDLLSKSNEGEKIKKDFTAILHVSTNTFYKSKDFHSDSPPWEYKSCQGLSIFKECIKKFGGKADEVSPKTSPLSG